MMKDFLQFIKEAAGVPENLVQTAQLVYVRIMEEFETIIPLYGSIGLTCETLKEYTIKYRENFRISNKNFPEIQIKFKMSFDKDLSEIEIEELQHVYGAKYGYVKDRGYKLKKFGGAKGATVSISLKMPENCEISKLKDFFIARKSEVISSITHELKHYFDLLIKSDITPGQTLDYSAYLQFVSDIFPLYDFIFKLYYFHNIENSVRPSELAGLLSSEGITKSNFKEFFFKTEIWDQIDGARKLTYEGIKEEMKDYSEEMDEVLTEYELMDLYNKMIEEKKFSDPLSGKIELVLHITFEYIKKLKIKELKKILIQDDLHPLRFRETSKEKFMTSYLTDIQKHDYYEDFFRSEIKKINRESNKLFRKVAGVYSLVPSDTSTNNSEKMSSFLKESVMSSNEWMKKYFK